MKQPTTTQRIEHIEESARRVIGAISSLAMSNDPDAIREMIDRHRAHLDGLRRDIATATPDSNRTRATLDRLDSILENVIDELDATRARLDAWKWGTDSIGIIAGLPKDIDYVIAIAIASILAHITR